MREQYGIAGNVVRDLGGSSNLNLLIEDAGHRYVARVHRPWVTASRLADVQAVRRELARGGVPCANLWKRARETPGSWSRTGWLKLSPTSSTTQTWTRGNASKLRFLCLAGRTS